MIKLRRAQKPAQLNDETVAALTAEFAKTGSSVWNVDYIKRPLLESSYGKCAYCEATLDEESKYMEVEHFRNKRDFPGEVVQWDNLLPACKRCNVHKGTHNVQNDGSIVNPYEVAPVEHLYLESYRLRWRDDTGRRTVDVVYLNDSERLVRPRFEVGEAIEESLCTLRELLEGYIRGPQYVRRKNMIVIGIRRLLGEAQPNSRYSAVAATVLLANPDYAWIRERLVEFELWDELEALEASALPLRLAR